MKRGKPEKYIGLAEDIRQLISRNRLKQGDVLPSERQLAAMFSCSHLTIRKALRLLEQEKLLHRKPSRGNYVGAKLGSDEGKQLVGILFPDHELFYYNIFSVLEEKLFSAGLHPVIHLTHNTRRKEEQILDFANRHGFAALVAAPNPLCAEQYAALPIPLVCFDVSLPDLSVPHVISDDYQGAMEASKHLLSLGHSRIAHLGCTYDHTAELRRKGLLDALKQAGIEAPKNYLHAGNPTRKWGYDATRALFALPLPPTAIFCGNDTIAAGARRYCYEHKIKVPEQCSLIGFGDTAVAEDIDLTSVCQHTDRIATALWNILRLSMSGEETPLETIISTSLSLRSSTAPLAI